MDARLADLQALADDVRRGEGSVSVVARVAGDEQAAVSLDPDTQHYSASIMKLPVLIAAHRLTEAGRLDLDEPVPVHDDFDSRNPGRRYTMDPDEDSDPESWAALGTEVPLGVLVHRMVVVSGNMATNLVLEAVGFDEVAKVLTESGCSERTAIVRGIEDYPAREIGLDNLITADDMARLTVALADGRLAGPAATEACEATLRAQTYLEGIPAGLPPGLVIGNKTGWIDGVNHDVALVRAEGLPPVGLAVLCSAPGTREEREAGIARMAAVAWDLVASPVPRPTLR